MTAVFLTAVLPFLLFLLVASLIFPAFVETGPLGAQIAHALVRL